MPFVYILKSLKDGNQYIGSTVDLQSRMSNHESGCVRSTKYRRPLKLYAYREVDTLYEARMIEKKYKQSHDSLLRDIRDGKVKIADIGLHLESLSGGHCPE